MSPEPFIFVVDDDEAVRGALTGLFEAEGFGVTAFDSAEAFLKADIHQRPHSCAVVDIQMPGMSGLDLQAELQRRESRLLLIFLTSHGDVTKAVTALKAGAADFIEKPFRIDDLMNAVHNALSRSKQSHLHSKATSDFVTKLTTLTPREKEVMNFIVEGDPNKLVAAKLGISVRTAEVHRSKILEKMGCSSSSALIHLVFRNSPPSA